MVHGPPGRASQKPASARHRGLESTARGGEEARADKAIALGRERYTDTNQWFWISSFIGALGLAALLAVAIPSIGWVPFLAIGLPGVAGSGVAMLGLGLPERLYAASHLSFLVIIGVVAAYTAGADSFLIALLCPFSLGFFSRLRPAAAMTYALSSFVLACAPVLVFDWVGFVDSPWLLGASAAGTLSVTLIAAPMAAGEIHHRAEATIDQLTGLLNRRGLEDRLAEIRDQALVIGEDIPMSLIACDLDHFKLVNDTYGHPRGDDVLRDVAYLLRKGLRQFELAYRMGGEEFLIVLPGHDSDAALGVAESIRIAIETGRPGGVDVTISIGVAVGRASERDSRRLLAVVDSAVYSAKRTGRNRVVLATDTSPETSADASFTSVPDYHI